MPVATLYYILLMYDVGYRIKTKVSFAALIKKAQFLYMEWLSFLPFRTSQRATLKENTATFYNVGMLHLSVRRKSLLCNNPSNPSLLASPCMYWPRKLESE